jgi:hypothetical protein
MDIKNHSKISGGRDSRSRRALERIRESAQRAGVDRTTLKEINREIALARKARSS